MDCPNCGTWNPNDKKQCWRCDAPLPEPEEPKKKRKPISWIWWAVILFVLFTLAQACWAFQARQQAPSPAPMGYHAPPAAVWVAPPAGQ